MIKSDNRSCYQDITRTGSDSVGMSWKRSGVVHGMSRTHVIVLAHSRECEKMRKMRKTTVSKIAGSSMVTEYPVGYPPDPCIWWMNIWSAIHLTPTYGEWIFGQQSTWPLHTVNEYSVSNPPDPFRQSPNMWSVIHLSPAYGEWIFGQQSTWPMQTVDKYLFSDPPDPCIQWMNIRSAIHLTHADGH
jgi:hypothetical protein